MDLKIREQKKGKRLVVRKVPGLVVKIAIEHGHLW